MIEISRRLCRVARMSVCLGLMLALGGCLLDGFRLPADYRVSEFSALEAVPDRSVYRLAGSADTAQQTIYLRFVLLDNRQYVMEQIVHDKARNEAAAQVVQATFQDAFDGWHALHWRDPRGRTQGFHLIRLARDHIAVAEVSKLDDAALRRIQAGSAFKLSRAMGGSGLKVDEMAPGALSTLLVMAKQPGLTTARLERIDAMPAELRNRAFMELVPTLAGLTYADIGDKDLSGRMLRYFRILHEEGVGAGSYALGRFALNGWGMATDTRLARQAATAAARLGVARANTTLGLLAVQGLDEPRDHARAYQLFEAAAKVEDGAALTQLGRMHLMGEGVPKDAVRAAQFFERGSAEGFPEARYQLADLLIDGKSIPRNDQRALELVDAAMAAGNPGAHGLRAWMHTQGRAGPADQVAASRLYLKAAQLGDPFSQWQIGERLLAGVGVPIDRPHGVEWLQRADKAGMSEARTTLARLSQTAAAPPAPPAPAPAGGYPARPITILLPTEGRGLSHALATNFADALRKTMGRNAVNLVPLAPQSPPRRIEWGDRAAIQLKSAAPDGYTLLFDHVGASPLGGILDTDHGVRYDDFEFLGLVAEVPMLLLARADLPPANPAQMKTWLENNKDRMTVGFVGAGTRPRSESSTAGWRLALLLQAQVKALSVPYMAGSEALADLEKGAIDFLFMDAFGAREAVERKRVRLLGVVGRPASGIGFLQPALTLNDWGLPDANVGMWYGLHAPKGTPRAVLDQLNAQLRSAVADKDHAHSQMASGALPVVDGRNAPAEHRRFVESEIRQFTRAMNEYMKK